MPKIEIDVSPYVFQLPLYHDKRVSGKGWIVRKNPINKMNEYWSAYPGMWKYSVHRSIVLVPGSYIMLKYLDTWCEPYEGMEDENDS